MKTNVFYHGDCLFVMKHDIPPESIDLIYLDPPFFGTGIQKGKIKNTKGKSIEWNPGTMQISYDDSKRFWSNQEIQDNAPMWIKAIATKVPKSHWSPLARYLYYMYERLQECKDVLKPTGSIYLHCDWRASHYLRMVMDEVFGYDGYRNEIAWKRGRAVVHTTGTQFTRLHDVLLFYAKTKDSFYNRKVVSYAPSTLKMYKYEDEKGKYRLQELRDYSKESINKLQKDGLIKQIITKKWGKKLFLKQYLNNESGVAISDFWDDIGSVSYEFRSERIGYPTQKPKALLNRIIEASSNPMDVVLDPFCGCGTTIEVAHDLGRRWIGIDMNDDAIDVIKQRLNKMGLTQTKLDFEIVYPVFKTSYEIIMKMNGIEFERWVNEICNAKKPSPDIGVDGIMKDGTPIQTKTYKVRYDVVSRLLADAEFHPKVPKPIKKIRVVSREGFDESATQRAFEIEEKKNIKVELKTAEDLAK